MIKILSICVTLRSSTTFAWKIFLGYCHPRQVILWSHQWGPLEAQCITPVLDGDLIDTMSNVQEAIVPPHEFNEVQEHLEANWGLVQEGVMGHGDA